MNLIKPCRGPIMSLYDSKRKHPKTGVVQPHWGVDYGVAPNNDIFAAASGEIRAIVRNHETAGNYVVIKHSNGWETAYLHLSSISVRVGQRVEQGERIGIKGATGKFVTGVHLHFEVAKGRWTGGSSLNVNPALYIDDPDVRTLQTNLNKLGYSLTVDGKYGDSTTKAVAGYQSKNKLTVDGVAGRLTMAAVEKSVNELKKEDVKVANVEYEKDAKPSPSLAAEFAEAIQLGITDGTYPNRPATRAEVAVMIVRASKKQK